MKNWWILHFFAVFLDFQIFQIFDDFLVIWVWNSTPWLDFLPGAAFKSVWAGISCVFRFFCSYGVHVPTLNCRNLDDCASAGALALHAQISLSILRLSIMNQALLRWWKLMNQKYFSYSVHVPTLNCRDLDDCASAGALALHAQIFLSNFWLSIRTRHFREDENWWTKNISHTVFMCRSVLPKCSQRKIFPDMA